MKQMSASVFFGRLWRSADANVDITNGLRDDYFILLATLNPRITLWRRGIEESIS